MADMSLILIVDDDIVVHKTLVAILKGASYDVIQAFDALEGIALAGEKRPDLILLDLKLPKVHGLKVLKQIKNDEKLRDIPVVVLTASDEPKDIISSYQRGAGSYFTKSVLFLKKGEDSAVILDTVMAMAGIHKKPPGSSERNHIGTMIEKEVVAYGV